ncbi:MAG: glycosyl hydrolase [Prevotella sp.]
MYRNILRLTLALTLIISSVTTQSQTIPTPDTARPGIRWWWLGSAVDSTNLQWNLEQFAKAGIGAVEITPIYGVKNNEANDISYLSPQWMKSLQLVEKIGSRLGIETNMATGTGWPFGGPWVPLSEAACKALAIDTLVNATTPMDEIEFALPERERGIARLIAKKEYDADNGMKRVIALYESRTRQQVKRAAPGGEGYVVNHFDSTAVAHYLAHIDSAFKASNTPFPPVLFNDSYEVYGANWTPTLPHEFERRHGYSLIDSLREFVDGDTMVVSDYRETLAHMLLNNFTRQWTEWAHRHGAKTRNQAHGSPANLIDCYAAVDIPEIEGFGLTDFGIKGLRRDSGFTRRNYSDLSMLKYAPSAAHITGKKLTSSETFTWLTEHFRTSLSQMKPDLDLMFCAGVNRMFFHGAAYSPKDDPWPGWRFYASVDMSPTNSIWRDAPELMAYITRCQTYLQWGRPDNDFLVYLPVHDMWKGDTRNWLMQFDIHSMSHKAPQFIKTILDIDGAGFDCDYISDQYLLTTTFSDGMLQTAAGTRYKGIIIPTNATLPNDVGRHIELLRQQGARIIEGDDTAAMEQAAKPEAMKKVLGLKTIRRSNDEGHHYFIANLTDHDITSRVPLAVSEQYALWYDPMTDSTCKANINADGLALNLRSGESRILLCRNTDSEAKAETELTDNAIDLTCNRWQLSFIEEQPTVGETFTLDGLQTWERLNATAATTMGTGVYETTFKLSKADAARNWAIDLGDVRESARVYINGTYIGCAWAVPFVLDCNDALRKGKNTLRIEVTNLPANRIADMDRRGIEWRKMKEINVVDINYKKTSYANWKPVPSGLNGKVKLTLKNLQ